MSQTFLWGLELMGYGLVGVFVTLAAFILMISLLTKFFPHREG